MLLTIAAIFVYYTIWTLILPFFDSDSPVHCCFPSREWAIRIPAFILVVGMSAIGIFLGSKIVHERPEDLKKKGR
ncbi:dolichol phosphate-mannose biosynthesis regulatory protein Dpm2 [Cytidiella melzeri]|nr:dolichol phosphate-mannose biosynthesis regulatory protein Dpm2 [Cytidiella melzeri]